MRHLEIKKSLKARPLSMHSSDIEGMVLPPKPPKRKNNDKKEKEKDRYKQPPPVSDDPKLDASTTTSKGGKVKKEKKEKTTILPSVRNTLKKKTKKQQQQQQQETADSSESSTSSDNVPSAFLPPQQMAHSPSISSLPPATSQPISKSGTISGSKISLNELQGGLKALAKRRPEVAALNESLTKTQEEETRRNSMGVARPLPPPKPADVESSGSQTSTLPRPRKPPLPPNRPLTLSRSTPPQKTTTSPELMKRSSPEPVEPSSPVLPAARRSPIPPIPPEEKPEKPVVPVNKPMPAARPSLKPRPSKPRPDILAPKPISELTIDQSALKPELVPVSECLLSVHKMLKNLISLANCRQSENIGEKVADSTTGCTDLVDKLSSYRDSIGPVARMKVNKHLTTIESNVNDFMTLSKDLPRIPTATDLEKISKILNSLNTSLEQLAKSLGDL